MFSRKSKSMLTKYQIDVLDYFDQRSTKFVDFLCKPDLFPSKFVIIEKIDLFGHSITFLDTELKYDLNLYVPRSVYYEKVEDMLIEVHTVKIPSAFSKEITVKAQQTFSI